MGKYRTTPQQIKGYPPGIPYIIGNEVAERFSFYGMKAILFVFLTKHLMNNLGQLDTMTNAEATAVVHTFVSAAYFTPLIGALIADIFFGKYLTIVTLSLLYCVGHGLLAVMDVAPMMDTSMLPWLYGGLMFIALGSGAIKPCVSAHVGDQFGTRNQHLVSKIFSWFYFSINAGAVLSQLLTPLLLEYVGPWLAFGLPGVLMAIATFVFWLGRHKFVHVPPAGWRQFRKETFGPEGRQAILNLAPVFLIFIPVFWALFDQTSSRWVAQAELLDRSVFGLFEVLPAQLQAVNPFLILVLIPVFAYGIYPAINKVFPLTPLRKIAIGMFIASAAFAVSSLIQAAIDDGQSPSMLWQVLAYVVMTSAEVMISITALEFAYTQAPRKMKSFIMAFYLVSVSVGNAVTALVNVFIQRDDGTLMLDGAAYYWFWTALMLVAAVGFAILCRFYKGRRYVQGEDEVEAPHCPKCDYNLTGIEGPTCPECGTHVVDVLSAADEASASLPGMAGPEGEHGSKQS